MISAMRIGCLVLFYCAPWHVVVAVAATTDRIALLKADDVIVVGADRKIITRLAGDSRHKSLLRWLPDGQRLSYLVPDDRGAKARLVVVDLKGTFVKEIPLRAVTDPPTEGLRFVEDVAWISASDIRVMGSVNPRNCEIFDVDLATSKESNGHFGECGSFAESPDGNHLAYLRPVNQGADSDRKDSVEIDDEKNLYSGGDAGIRVISGPIWSEDSGRVAFIEKQRDSGEVAVTTISTGRNVDRVPVPADGLEHPKLMWVDSKLVIKDGAAFLIDSRLRTVTPVTPSVSARIESIKRSERQKLDLNNSTEEIVAEFGGREGVRSTLGSPASH
jgi:Tol biopolymer transport system component